jgi:hypothetical protein
VKICPLPARVIRRPKTNADGSEIESIPNCDFEFPNANCEEWIKRMYEVNGCIILINTTVCT